MTLGYQAIPLYLHRCGGGKGLCSAGFNPLRLPRSLYYNEIVSTGFGDRQSIYSENNDLQGKRIASSRCDITRGGEP